jgi:transcriptional regulator with GAF, ATPase, and Fis domain
VVPFSFLGLALYDEASGHVEPHVLEATGEPGTPPVLTTPGQLTHWVLEHRQPLVIADVATEPQFAEEMAYLHRQKAVCACCLPLIAPQRRVGMLITASRQPHVFEDDEVFFLALVANQVALAIDDTLNFGALQASLALERSRLHALNTSDALLQALSPALDIREVFTQVSAIARRVIPHDLLSLLLLADDGSVTVYAVAGGEIQFPRSMPLPEHRRHLLTDEWDHLIERDLLDHPIERDQLAAQLGYRARLLLPIRLRGTLVGSLDFVSKTPAAYRPADVVVARRIADQVALALSHHRLAEESRRAELLRARESTLILLDELLLTVTDTGKLPEIWDRISAIVQNVLPHDALLLSALLPDGVRGRVYASKAPGSAAFAEIVHVPPAVLQNPQWEYDVVDDLQARPDQAELESTKLGYRAALRVPLRLDGEYVAAISVLSFTPAAYGPDDVQTALRVARHIVQGFARERREALRKRADEASERVTRLEARVKALTDELDARTGRRRVVGESPQWKQVLRQATQVAATDTTVLLLGDSGTGKEVVARFVHRASPRAEGPFVALNCAALPEQLLESELFGHERGAFTGAIAAKPGLIEQAAGGVLFLDEVSEMPPPAQAKFLRVLQEREFQRVGGTRPLKSNVRVVAATNRDLEQAIARGTFREDLYYRLHVFEIRLPPLRDRRDDIMPLSEAFLEELGREVGRPPAGISREAREILLAYHWPGNVRQLRNSLERAAILCEGGLITGEHLSLPGQPQPPPAPPAGAPAPARGADAAPEVASAAAAPPGDLATMERAAIEKALHDARFNKAKAARALGLTRTQLYVRLRKYGLE